MPERLQFLPMAQARLESDFLRKIILKGPRILGGRRFGELISNLAGGAFGKPPPFAVPILDKLRVALNTKNFNDVNKYFKDEPIMQLEDVLLSGSFSEGLSTKNLNTMPGLSDLDYMCILKNITVTKSDQEMGNLVMSEKTPFVTLYLSNADLQEKWSEFMETTSTPSNGKKMLLSSMKLKEKLAENYRRVGPLFEKCNEKAEQVGDGASFAVQVVNPKDDNSKLSGVKVSGIKASYDFVLAIKCEGWPACAMEWLERSRQCPNEDLIQQITALNFHIVCKSSSDGTFCLSFSNAEYLLINNFSDLQHKVCRAFKSCVKFVKRQLDAESSKLLCSYHLKTIALWYCEKTDPADWNEENVLTHLYSLINHLISALRTMNLPMYFMPKYNLLQNCKDGAAVCSELENLLSDTPGMINAFEHEEKDCNLRIFQQFVLGDFANKVKESISWSRDNFHTFFQSLRDRCLNQGEILDEELNDETREYLSMMKDDSLLKQFSDIAASENQFKRQIQEVMRLYGSQKIEDLQRMLTIFKQLESDDNLWQNLSAVSPELVSDVRPTIKPDILEIEESIREKEKERIAGAFDGLSLD